MSPILQGLANGSVRGYGGYLPLGPSGAFESIASVTGSGGNELTFSSIPSTYKHLQIRGIYKDTETGGFVTDMKIRFNSDSGFNYSWHNIFATGSAVSASGNASMSSIQIESAGYQGSTSGIHGVSIVDIHDYANTSRNKTVRCFSGCDINGVNGSLTLTSGAYYSTSAITSITLLRGSSAFGTTSRFDLYGIKGA